MDMLGTGIVRGFADEMFCFVLVMVREQNVHSFRRPESREKQQHCPCANALICPILLQKKI